VSGHHFQSKLELIEELALIKMLEQPAAEKAKGGNAPVKKAPRLNAPTLEAAIDNAGGELQKGGAGGAMSFIGAMPVKKYVPGSVQGVLPVKGDFIEALWTEDGKVKGWVRCGSSTGRRASATGQE
jgi:hypothetical protein